MNLINKLNWRYATKRMTGEKISEENLNTILEAVRLTPTAYGLQPFSLIVTDNKELLDEIYEKACPQVVIQQVSHLLIFKANKKLDEKYMETYLEEIKRSRNQTDKDVVGSRRLIQRVLANPAINNFNWTTHQTYIALGYATIAAVELGIDATPIEGFNPAALNELLGLNTDKEEAVVMLTLGYRDTEADPMASLAKVRKPMAALVERR